MPKNKLDDQMKEIKRQTGMSFVELRKTANAEYIRNYDFTKAREREVRNRKNIIRYAIKKHGKLAKKVLAQMRMPIKKVEKQLYKELLNTYNENKYRNTA